MRVGVCCSVWLLSFGLSAQDWPAFRGPKGDGICASERRLPLRWNGRTGANIRWKAALSHPANGSPIVSGGRVFVTCPRDSQGKQRALICFDRQDGRELWSRTVEFHKVMPTHKTNPYCGSTPAADGTRVVVWHASAGLWCHDFHGKELWRRDLGEFRHRWGYGTSPILHDGKVFLHSGPGRGVFVTALDLESGKTIWRTDEPVEGDGQDNAEGRLMGSWCTPILAHDQLICTMPTRVVAYDPGNGRILWWCGGLSCSRGDLVYSSPVVAGDLCLVIGGYEGPELGIRLGGKGDVTGTRRLWRHPRRQSNVGSGVVVGGRLYRSSIRGDLVCVEPATGERLWSERPAKAQIWGSIVHGDGHLFVTNQKGTTIVFRPDPRKLEVVATNELSEPTNSTPAISEGEIFLRTHKHLYCVSRMDEEAASRPATQPAGRPRSRRHLR